ncbi:fimbria/pilus periplasmic chaperone [Candidatus Williamhamiltonella defendens]|uniref:Uncharacterized protein n=1 Tax=Hamiltonella defensa subsp. Acyrthosiphon pisum (strain 5AT) TaxID=572265 RepID=C4K419_HAMD5|nr:fimbria/pilus periplasmic chaperone [Candidatus Hamiltonella defensa]ACQ67312.1 hypothetical protein HDEF_0565 [Candidatus Hamiltonella defensa 5AT (Acyrthosiphon pisum)]
MNIKWKPLIFLSCFINAHSNAQLIAIPSRINLEALEKGQTVKVFNKGDASLYLEAKLYRVENPGHTPESQTLIGEIPHPQMMFNPARMSLGPKQERDIHLIPLKSPEQETLYRLYITPVTQTRITGTRDEKKEMALTVGIAYGVLIHYLPEKSLQKRGWEYQCLKGKGIQLTTTGTVQSPFRHLKSHHKEHISETQNVYPGTPVTLPRIKKLTGKVFNEDVQIDCS